MGIVRLVSAIFGWFFPPLQIPFHIAVIPNGNRRWAKLRKILLQYSYLHGAKQALDFAAWAKKAGVRHVTFYGLSEENMVKRSVEEIDALMKGAIHFFDTAMALGYHLHPFGDIEKFAGLEKYEPLYSRLRRWRELPLPPDDFVLHVAVNYAGTPQHELEPLREEIRNRGLHAVLANPAAYIRSAGVPEVDLVVRTGSKRESRTSGLLPFQLRYAELLFINVYWGDFTERHFRKALRWYSTRQRNFGK